VGNCNEWKDNIKVDLIETECEHADVTELAQGRFRRWASVNTLLNFQVPQRKLLS
jgi:hypothetical protein